MADITSHKSRTDMRRIFKLEGIDLVIRHIWPLFKVKRSTVKVTRSRNVTAATTLSVKNSRINFKLGGNYHRGWPITARFLGQ